MLLAATRCYTASGREAQQNAWCKICVESCPRNQIQAESLNSKMFGLSAFRRPNDIAVAMLRRTKFI